MLYNAGTSAVGLGTTDPALGSAAKAVARTLLRGPPIERRPGLVHGTLYTRHILDLGDGPGVIDWQQFGQGPLELDAGTFLASLTRTRLRHDSLATEAAKAEEAFLSTTRTLFDERALDWYWAAGLLHVVASGLKDGLKHSAPPEAKALIQIAAQRAERAVAGETLPDAESSSLLERLRSAFSTRRRAHGTLAADRPSTEPGRESKTESPPPEKPPDDVHQENSR